MAFDGIITCAMVKELQNKIYLGKIEKVYQPENDELVFHIHTKTGNVKLFASVGSAHARLHFIEENPKNPPVPLAFCMLLRKHLQGGRIVEISQKDSERIIEISLETLNELGFNVSKKLIFEIMGKHSNIILVDMTTGKIIDSIKRVSIDVNRVRQVLPGKEYEYPPVQDKIPFKVITADQLGAIDANSKAILSQVGGISPAIAWELTAKKDRYGFLQQILESIASGTFVPRVYLDEKDVPQEFHITDLTEYEDAARRMDFQTLSQCLAYYFDNKASSNRARQKSHDLVKSVTTTLDKLYLKKQRLSEDLLKAENSEDLRLYGELLTANMHLIKPGDKSVEVVNYYDNSTVKIPLDERHTPAKNAQQYFKRYGKAKTAVKEKQIQLEEVDDDIKYLESVLSYLNNTDSIEEIEALRTELIETGYIRRRKTTFKEKKYKPQPHRYETTDGFTVLVGRNNKENDYLTLKTASKADIWFHTKDIPGSHVIVQTDGKELSESDIFEAAAIAAYHSKGRTSENVPVDYVAVRYVKKPAGAKPGMVIFTNNKTVWVNPGLPE
ncbi:NFACT RNA binding domain-containing protein [Emergencia timonensis]|uniref:Rqc2 family fibronectin-binding protein n=1 Tax=Emergencia timonensis TaxID=1776384 RepID=UPI000833C6B2|nr:NFACT RNA binding domain-containing protein [Emergencia timonensis]WNX90305.1 NFACT RNA binding domain-containing protein [Emergencia timonensis]